jgi:glutamyl-tRNA reductase
VEVTVAADDFIAAKHSVEIFLTGAQHLDPESLRQYLYVFEGKEAVRHLFRVASSLDSMVIGEPQILGQLKSAYSVAKETGSVGSVGGFLETVLMRAFGVAKRVRSETEIGANAVSVSYAAVELAREIFGSLKGRRVMLIGAGKMSELAARHLNRSGVRQILVTNRTPGRAEEVAEMVNGSIVDYEQYKARLKDVDIVITSSGAPGYLLTKEDLKPILSARKNKPMFLIDIAVPRNIDPAVNELDNVFVYDIDDLQQAVAENLKTRHSEAAEADKIVAEEVERLESWIRTRQVGPVIAALQDQLEQLRAAEIERMRGKLGPLTPQQELAIEALTRGIINKIAHGPIAELRRQAAADNGLETLDRIRSMFRLEG